MTPFPVRARGDVPALTADQMREVDRIMIAEQHIELLQMMENAGRSLADVAIALYRPETVVVLAGSGGNGGGGLVGARHLANRGVDVGVVLGAPDRMTAAAAHQLDIVERMGIRVVDAVPAVDLVVDALLGYSLRGAPRGHSAELIRAIGDAGVPVLSLDVPSGVEPTTGVASQPCVEAAATLTLALPKAGLLGAASVGDLYLADISVPRCVYERIGVDLESCPDLFARGAVVALT